MEEKKYIEVEDEMPAKQADCLDITKQLADAGKNVLVAFCRQQEKCVGCCYNGRYGCVVRVPKDWPEGNQDIPHGECKINNKKCSICDEYTELPTEHGIVRRCKEYKRLLEEKHAERERPDWCAKGENNGKTN